MTIDGFQMTLLQQRIVPLGDLALAQGAFPNKTESVISGGEKGIFLNFTI